MKKIKLIKMNENEYKIWHLKSIESYRDENHKNGMTLAEAQKKSDEDFARLLPQGFLTPDQFIFTIKEDDQWIGTLWFGIRGASDNRKAFIYDIALEESTRGKGYGKQAMLLLEEEVKKIGLAHIGLHVFGHNTVARNLYTSLGYDITNLNMEKKL